jgi:hypothetical protein
MRAIRYFIPIILLTVLVAAPAMAADGHPGSTNYLRGGYQAGWVLGTNDFLKGDNLSGEPIDRFQSLRIELGWQTDGSRDWHHVYDFPSYGIGLYGADLGNEEELGYPTSLYGFYVWPLQRTGKWTFNFELAFGFTNDWKPYDPVTNPKNVAMGLGRSVHIEGGPSAEYRFADRWSVVGSFTFTHFSNGGTQRPNHGINQVGPMLSVKMDTETPVAPPARRDVGSYDRDWDLVVTGSGGKRNLNLEFTDPALREEYLNRNYFIGNLTAGVGRNFSHKSRYVFGLDLGYDESVEDLVELAAFNDGRNETGSAGDRFELAAFAGYEIRAHRTHLLVHLGYKLLYKDVEGRLPVFYQRLGVRQYFSREWFAGLNVRFHEIGSADNLEWNLGYAIGL